MSIENFDYVISLIEAARDEPHENPDFRYELLHRASEYIILELMGEVELDGRSR